MKITRKTLLQIFGFMVIISGCNDELDELELVESIQENHQTVYQKQISADDIPELADLVSKKIGGEKANLTMKTDNHESLDGYTINWDEVNVLTDSVGITNYAFRLETKKPDPLVFYNIIVTEDEKGKTLDPIIAEYVVDKDFYLEWRDDPDKLRDFTGEVYYYNMDGSTFSKSGKTATLNAKTPRPGQPPCPSVTFGSPPGGGSTIPNIYCWTYVSYGLCETQINYDTGSSHHGSNSCGAGTGSPIYGYGVTCNTGGGTPPPRNTSKGSETGKSPCGPGGATRPGGVPINPITPGMADIGSFVGVLDNKLQLTKEQEDFLEKRPEAELILEISLLLKKENYSNESKIASRMTIEAARYGLLRGPYNSSYYSKINPYVSQNLNNPQLAAIWAVHFSMQCAIMKLENPGWSNTRVYWEASQEMVHLLLDLGGLVPVVGEVCDIANGVIYTIKGDGVNATLSFAAAVPIAGWFATGAKFAKKGIALANGSKTTLKWVVKANNVVNFGNRFQLAKVLGTAGTGKHAHHIIPWDLKEFSIVQKAAKSKKAFHMNEALNGIPLPSTNHLTGHQKYNSKVNITLNDLNTSNISNDLAYDRLIRFIDYLDNLIKANPNKNLGQIADLITYGK